MERVKFNGWECLRLANCEIELIITRDVGPRIIRCGFIGARNLFGEYPAQQGGRGETEWQIRGGHRLWVAPEAKPWSYELDNKPYAAAEAIPNGVRLRQEAGALTQLVKEMTVVLDPERNEVALTHTLCNVGAKPVMCAAWALSVMAQDGLAVIPLPAKIPHSERLTHNQNWSIWAYTDLSDPRWTLGSRYIRLRHDRQRGPTKLGIAHREQWVAYRLDGYLFVKRFAYLDGAAYPDGGVNFEIFANEEILELESLGALVTLPPGGATTLGETWRFFKETPECVSEDDIEKHIAARAR